MSISATNRRPCAQIAAILIALQPVLASCAAPGRLPAVPAAAADRAQTGVGAVRFLVARDHKALEQEALSALQKERAYLASTGHSGPLPPANYLALSGGGDNGAFGAGLLVGWTASGTRPEFKAVTGISTGALIAPFAFLGWKYDNVLQAIFTTASKDDIFKKRGIIQGLLGDAMADTAPLARLVEQYADQPLLDAIAQEYAKGRLLLVGTTNLDTLEPVIWNMTAIAASRDPRAPKLFRSVLLASASIPGGFPPVMLDAEVDGVRYQEMHVDGGTVSQVFLYPPSLRLADVPGVEAAPRRRAVYIIRNARLDPDWASVERRVLPIAMRAIASLTQTQGIGDLYRIYAATQRDGIDYNLVYIPSSFNVPHRQQFDTNYMQQLFATGRELAAKGYSWQKVPPGYEGSGVLARRDGDPGR